ncbi:MAG: hypothetical protein IJZ77_03140 [Bacilli bacterium]|nr:hypothetical protein [Bacilli bacterium]
MLELVSAMLMVVSATMYENTGMTEYDRAVASITTESNDGMSTQEIEAFNSNIVVYEGEQTGSQVKAMIQRLQAIAKTYQDEENKVPTVHVTQLRSSDNCNENECLYGAELEGGSLEVYVNNLSKISNSVELKHKYTVVVSYNVDGLISDITINYGTENDNEYVTDYMCEKTEDGEHIELYEKNNSVIENDENANQDDNSDEQEEVQIPIYPYSDYVQDEQPNEDEMFSNNDSESDTMNQEVIEKINENFEVYEGMQTGSQIKALLQRLQANAKTYDTEHIKVPVVHITQLNADDVCESGVCLYGAEYAEYDLDENALQKYIDNLSFIADKVELKHKYTVIFSYNEEGIIRDITINYGTESDNEYATSWDCAQTENGNHFDNLNNEEDM